MLFQRSSPSSEMVMIDRTFNQEERGNLTQDKRMILVDPGETWEPSCIFTVFYIILNEWTNTNVMS